MQVWLALYLLTIAFRASDRDQAPAPRSACWTARRLQCKPLGGAPGVQVRVSLSPCKVGFPGTQSSGSRARLSPLQRGHSAISLMSPRSLPRVSLLLVSLLTCLFSLNFQNNFLGV